METSESVAIEPSLFAIAEDGSLLGSKLHGADSDVECAWSLMESGCLKPEDSAAELVPLNSNVSLNSITWRDIPFPLVMRCSITVSNHGETLVKLANSARVDDY